MGISDLNNIVRAFKNDTFTAWKQDGTKTRLVTGPYYFDWWDINGTVTGSLTQVLSANQGGTYYVSSHYGTWRYTNPDSVNAESCCISKFNVWGDNQSEAHLYDRVWACRGLVFSNSNASVTSIAFVRSFEAARAELWLGYYANAASMSSNITVTYLDASGTVTNGTITISLDTSGGASPRNGNTQQLFHCPLGISRVQSVSVFPSHPTGGEYGFIIRVPKATAAFYQENKTPLQHGLSKVGSNECFEIVTIPSSTLVANFKDYPRMRYSITLMRG